MRSLRMMAVGQGIALVGLGTWPIVSMSTFERVTGPKHDDWLVRTVGGLCIAIGTGLVAGRDRPTVVRPLGVASAATFLVADVIGYRTGRLRAVYLADAVAEGALIAGWVAASIPERSPRPACRPTDRPTGDTDHGWATEIDRPAVRPGPDASPRRSAPRGSAAPRRAGLARIDTADVDPGALSRLERAAERLDAAVAGDRRSGRCRGDATTLEAHGCRHRRRHEHPGIRVPRQLLNRMTIPR